MSILPKEVESKMQARFPDCDPFNHLNNSKYIDYFINAREDQLIRFYDFDVHKMVKELGITWVVAQTQIAYMAPVEIMEVVTIQTRLLSYNSRSILLEGIMWNEDKTQVKALMWSKQAHYDLKSRRSYEHSNDLLALFNEIHYPVEEGLSFDDRVRSFKPIKHRS